VTRREALRLTLPPVATAAGAAPGAPLASGPTAAAALEFERYARATEARLAAPAPGEHRFLFADTDARRSQLRRGAILCEPRNRRGDLKISGGLIHDWTGAVFLPRASLSQVMALVRDYDRHYLVYRPDVVRSRILSRDGDRYSVFLRLMKRKAITVVLDTRHDVLYEPFEAGCWQSRSRSTSIVEIEHAGGPRERAMPEGRDHGFLWRLNSWWRFHQADGGVYVECEAISLSRSIPAALRYLIAPMVGGLPREMLAATLRATAAGIATPAVRRPE
jgi:hypothetical protein